jgi:predicted transcriptional regulator
MRVGPVAVVMTMVEVTDTQREYLQELIAHPDPVVTSVDMAEARDVSKQAAYNALENLHDKGLIGKKNVGARSVVYYSTPEARQLI